MESKKFDNYSNPYLTFTPIDEQVSIWLESHPEVSIKDINMTDRDAIVYYERDDK
jgi:hypothetical protein